MTTVQTVLGPIDVADLGPTLVHEHVRIAYPGDHLDPNDRWDRAACIDTAVERMHQLADFGVRTFVDPCPIDLGRDPELLAEVAQRSGMQIVCATGFYVEEIGIPFYWRARTVEEVAEFYLHELANGIGTTGIKPGIIKCASGDPPTDLERRVMAAGAMVAAETGVTVVTHCENSVGGDVQQDAFEAAGVDLSRCLIGHQGQAADAAQHVAIAARGSFVGFDRVGIELLTPDARQAELVMALLAAGHGERVCLSQDHSCCLRSARWPYPIPDHARELFARMQPAVEEQMYRRPHTFLFTDFWPRLEALGMDKDTFDRIISENPRRLFGG